MLVGKREGGTSWKIDEEIMEEVEELKYLGVWFYRKLRGNVHLEKMANKAEEWVGKVMWMSRVNRQVEVGRGRMVWELIRRLRVDHTARVWWSVGCSVCRKLDQHGSAGRSRVAEAGGEEGRNESVVW